ncbi:hypothetical protein HDU76_001137 [Blyttiomyces sp. JEL0837]|nr:hypothetical protein HDU76_001137 [Blyttiomyces sp. JEL0837]
MLRLSNVPLPSRSEYRLRLYVDGERLPSGTLLLNLESTITESNPMQVRVSMKTYSDIVIPVDPVEVFFTNLWDGFMKFIVLSPASKGGIINSVSGKTFKYTMTAPIEPWQMSVHLRRQIWTQDMLRLSEVLPTYTEHGLRLYVDGERPLLYTLLSDLKSGITESNPMKVRVSKTTYTDVVIPVDPVEEYFNNMWDGFMKFIGLRESLTKNTNGMNDENVATVHLSLTRRLCRQKNQRIRK